MILLSSIMYGIEPTFCSLVTNSGFTSTEVALCLNLFSVLACFALTGLFRINLRIGRGNIVKLLLFGSLGAGLTNLLLTEAYRHLPVGTVTVLHFLYPTLVCLIVVVCFRKSLNQYKIIAIASSILGLWFISAGNISGNAVGFAIAIGSALVYAIYIVGINHAQIEHGHPVAEYMYLSAGGFFFCLIAGVLSGGFTFQADANASMTIFYLFLAWLTSFIGGVSFVIGVEKEGSTLASFFSLAEPILSVVFSSIFLRSGIVIGVALGCILIVISILFINLGEAKENRASA